MTTSRSGCPRSTTAPSTRPRRRARRCQTGRLTRWTARMPRRRPRGSPRCASSSSRVQPTPSTRRSTTRSPACMWPPRRSRGAAGREARGPPPEARPYAEALQRGASGGCSGVHPSLPHPPSSGLPPSHASPPRVGLRLRAATRLPAAFTACSRACWSPPAAGFPRLYISRLHLCVAGGRWASSTRSSARPVCPPRCARAWPITTSSSATCSSTTSPRAPPTARRPPTDCR